MEKIAYEVLVCLSVLGRLGIVHCDLKPENVLLVDERSLKIKVRCGPFWFKLIPWFVNLGQTSSMWCYSWLHEFLDLRLCVYLTCDYSSTLYLLSVVPFWCYWLKEYFDTLYYYYYRALRSETRECAAGVWAEPEDQGPLFLIEGVLLFATLVILDWRSSLIPWFVKRTSYLVQTFYFVKKVRCGVILDWSLFVIPLKQ